MDFTLPKSVFAMAVDYLSALNVGSGLNVTQIVDALVDAEKVPQESRIQEQVEERNTSISSLGDVKSDLNVFKSNLDVYKGETGLITASSNSDAVSIANNGKIAVQPFTHSVTVNNLAQSHTLAFFGFSSDTDAINADSVQIELGTWDRVGNSFTANPSGTAATITIDGTNNTLQSFADAINAKNIGVKANVVRIDESSYALSVISPTGEAKQMRITAVSGGSQNGSLSFTDAAAHAGKEVTVGEDADFTLDGLSITRDTNSIDDIVNGVTLELKKETSNAVAVSANYEKATALKNLQDFVTDLNFLINKLTELTYRGSPSGDDAGPLADDNLIKGYLRSFKRMTTTPISGFQEETLYLSNFGVMTELDGSVTINETKFNEFFDANPDAYSAITNTRAISDSNLVQAEITGTLWKTGTYEFDKSPTAAVAEVQTSSGVATASAVAEVQTSSGTATASAVAEVQTSSGTTTASAHTIGDVYSLTVGSTTLNTAASNATTDYDTVAKIAAALDAAAIAAAANFSVAESGGELVVTYNTAQAQTDEAVSMSFTAGTPGATFTPPTFSVTTQGAAAHTIGDVYSLTVGSTTLNTAASTATTDYDTVAKIAAALDTAATAASADFSVAESGGELVITYDTAQTQADEAVSMSFTAGSAGAAFTPPTFGVTTQGLDPGTAARLYKLDESGIRIGAGDAMVFEGGKFKITSGDARGLALTMLGNGEDATIFIGKSLMETIQEFTENILVPNNDIDIKIQGYNDDITDFNQRITDLNERMKSTRDRYTEQFTAMESSVASFKKTGDLLTNFMDSWRASLRG